MRILFFTCLLVISSFASAQMTGQEALAKSIQYHDPQGEWSSFQGTLFLEFENPEGVRSPSQVLIDLPNSTFRHVDARREKEIVRFEGKDTCYATLGGSTNFTDEEAKKFRLKCENVQMYRDYFTYLYGLPMKLKDPGTVVQEKLIDTTILQARHLAVKVTYEAEVGSDIWLFYLDPETFALKAYQFYRDEESKKGEIILLSGVYRYRNLIIPRHRSWYTFPDNKFLGTDRLEKIE